MALTRWQEKYLLEEEIEIFLEKEFVLVVNCCVQPNMKMTCNLWFTTSMLLH